MDNSIKRGTRPGGRGTRPWSCGQRPGERGGRPVNPSTAFGSVLADELARCGLREVVIAPGSRDRKSVV